MFGCFVDHALRANCSSVFVPLLNAMHVPLDSNERTGGYAHTGTTAMGRSRPAMAMVAIASRPILADIRKRWSGTVCCCRELGAPVVAFTSASPW